MFSSWWNKSSAGSFSCDFGDPVQLNGLTIGAGAFGLHSGTQKSNQTPVSVFVCSETDGPTLASAAGSVKKLKTLRHPSVILFIDAHESDKAVLLATESVQPLLIHLQKSFDLEDAYLAWGILQVSLFLSYLTRNF